MLKIIKKFLHLNREKKIEKDKMLMNILLSHFTVLIIPIFVNIVLAVFLIASVQNEVDNSNFMATENLRSSIDQVLENCLKISRQINMNNSMTSMYNYNSQEDIYNLKESIDLLQVTASSTDDISDIFVYNPYTDIAISTLSRGSSEVFFNTYYSGTEYDFDSWKNEILDLTDEEFQAVMDSENKNVKYVEYRMPLTGRYIENIKSEIGYPAIIIIRINQIGFTMSDIVSKQYPAMSIFTVEDNGNIIGTQPDFDINTEKIVNAVIDEPFVKLKEHGVTYLCESSRLADWTYVAATPTFEYSKKYMIAIILTIISIFVLLILGTKIIMNFIKNNYYGILNIVRSLKKEAGARGDEFGIEDAQAYLSDLVSNKKSMVAEIEKNSDIVKNNCILRLLNGLDIYDNTVYSEICAEMASDKFAVIVCLVENSDRLYEGSGHEGISTEIKLRDASFIVSNILTELLEKKYRVYSVAVRQYRVFVAGSSENDRFLNDLCKQCRDFSLYALDKFGIELSTSIGVEVNALSDISVSYGNALNAIPYRFIAERPAVISGGSIGIRSDMYEITQQHRQQFEVNLELGNGSECEYIIREIIDSNVNDRSMSAEMIRCFIIELTDMISDAVLKSSDLFDVNLKNNMLVEILAKERIGDCIDYYTSVIREVCQNRKQVKKDRFESLIDDIKNYINNNFCEKDINVSSVAEYAGMSRAYVSKIFKQREGISILDYIHKKRIEAALTLLEGKDSINDIADKIGYANGSVFIHSFKTRIGVTPNQYREKIQK